MCSLTWYIYTVECYADIRKDEILPFGTTELDLETIVLSKISQTKKSRTMWLPSYVRYKAENNKCTNKANKI